MSEFAFNLIRLGYLALLWLFILFAVAVLRRDLSIRGAAARRVTTPQGAITNSQPSNGSFDPAIPGYPVAPVGAPVPNQGFVVVPNQITEAEPMIVVGKPVTPTGLAVTAGPLAGSVLPLLNQPITIGRGANNTLVLEDDYASSRHACIYPVDDGWVVEDLNSTNGTIVAGAPLEGATPLGLHVPVRIGSSVLELVS